MDSEKMDVIGLEALVEEMLKPNPCDKTVKTMMKDHGISYSTDPIERINLVLRALHFSEDETAPEAGKGN